MKKVRIIFMAAIFMFSVPSYAEIMYGYTTEWLAHQSDLIALATPVEIESDGGTGSSWFIKTRFRLDEIIKGPQSDGDIVTIYDLSPSYAAPFPFSDAMKNKSRILIFAKISEQMYHKIDGKYDLSERSMFRSVYYPDKPVTKLFTPDFKLLTDFNDLLKRTKAQVAYENDLKDKYSKGMIAKISAEVPFDSEAHKYLYAGSSCFLWIPQYIEPVKIETIINSSAQKKDNEQNDANRTQEWEILIKSKDYDLRTAGRQMVLDQYNKTVQTLMDIVNSPVKESDQFYNYNTTRNTAIYLLGKLMAREAVPSLIKWIKPDPNRPEVISEALFFSPAGYALIDIGLSSIPPLAELLKNEIKPDNREVYLKIIVGIKGIQETQLLIDNMRSKEISQSRLLNLQNAQELLKDPKRQGMFNAAAKYAIGN